MGNLPDLTGSSTPDIPRRTQSALQRSVARADVDVFRHRLAASTKAQKDMVDSIVLGQALTCALDCELDLVNYGLSRAGQSAAALELVARKADIFSRINNRRIEQRFS